MKLTGVLEGLLFLVGDEGLSYERIKEILEIEVSEVDKIVKELKDIYNDENRGISIELLGDTLKLVTKKEHNEYYEKLVESEKRGPLGQAALETVAIIAYNEPITRSYVEEIRGVDSSYVIRKLLFRNLIKEVGRAELPGRPILYGITPTFLDCLGLSSIDQLPKLEKQESIDSEIDLYESKFKE
ncbi:MAG: SMC-Scp complex subunit ScpB [Bacilli bacterium]|nr:SMC-Scp complex subunit ScpB [Bacilli bacterium]MDD4607665.1 SMC-Scp complex subunit ScpB [Bacilli bacterium]